MGGLIQAGGHKALHDRGILGGSQIHDRAVEILPAEVLDVGQRVQTVKQRCLAEPAPVP